MIDKEDDHCISTYPHRIKFIKNYGITYTDIIKQQFLLYSYIIFLIAKLTCKVFRLIVQYMRKHNIVIDFDNVSESLNGDCFNHSAFIALIIVLSDK